MGLLASKPRSDKQKRSYLLNIRAEGVLKGLLEGAQPNFIESA